MNESTPMFWTELFGAGGKADITLNVRVIKKSGEAFLILPDAPGMAAEALALYPAQTKFAKLARGALGIILKLRLPFGSSRATAQLSRGDAFARFLNGLVASKPGGFPPLAVLAGNARTAGRRFIVLLFDEQGRPAFAVKAGIGEAARRLIQKENLFRRSVPAGVTGLRPVRSVFSSERVEALALDYVVGDTPEAGDWEGVGKLLSTWVNRNKRVRVEELATWKLLESQHGGEPLFEELAEALKDASCHATLFHGDFAPWNIKVNESGWTALDWERGELTGFPGWDWFHYVIQTGILVEKLSAEELARDLEELLADASFQSYAELSGIMEREKVLVVAYLFYCVKVLRPTEGKAVAEALLALLAERWL